LKIEIENYSENLERATGIEPVLPAWESNLSSLYFQYLQNRSAKTYVHALHTVHAVPDLRIAAGRSAGRFPTMLYCSRPKIEAYFLGHEATRHSGSLITNYLRAKTLTA
jgi:hypothetical protein